MKAKKSILIIVLVLIAVVSLNAEQWLRDAGGYTAYVSEIEVSPEGDIYVLGSFRGFFQIENIKLNSTQNTKKRKPTADVFLAKYNGSGKLLWIKTGLSGEHSVPKSLAVNSTGAIITGHYRNQIKFDAMMLNSKSKRNSVFIVSYSNRGKVQWAKTSNNLKFATSSKAVCDSQGDVIIGGTFDQFFSVGKYSIKKQMSKNIFLVKISSSGVVKWLKLITGGNSFITGVYLNTMAVTNDDRIVFSGTLSGKNKFDNYIYVSPKQYFGKNESLYISEGYAAYYDSRGKFLQLQPLMQEVDVWSIALDKNNNKYITGFFKGRAAGKDQYYAFFGKKKIKANMRSEGTSSEDIFLASFNIDGNLNWVFHGGGPDTDRGKDVVVDNVNNKVYLTGTFSKTAKFGRFILNERDGKSWATDVFTAVLNMQSGFVEKIYHAGSTGNDRVSSIAIDDNNSIYIGGQFRSFFQAIGKKISSKKYDQIFLLKYNN